MPIALLLNNTNFMRYREIWLDTSIRKYIQEQIKHVNTAKQMAVNTNCVIHFYPVFSGIRIVRALVLCVCFVDHCLPLGPFSFGHCVACPFSSYGF
jgi:hypothetical protein